MRLEDRLCVVTWCLRRDRRRRPWAVFQREGARVLGADLAAGAPGDLSLQVDVTDERQVLDMYAAAVERFGRIDVLFNNAGISPPDDGSVLDTTLEALGARAAGEPAQRVPVLQARHPHLLRGGGGSVINTASFVAVMGAATSQISYTASKGGVLALLARAGRGVRAPRRPRQRAVPRSRRHAACCRSSTPPIPSRPRDARPRADRPLCPGRGDRQRRPVPCLRRVELRDGLDVPRRRRPQRRLHERPCKPGAGVH